MTRKKNNIFSYATPREISSEIKRIWESEMRFPSSKQIIEDVDRALEAFDIVYHAHGATFEGLVYCHGHRRPLLGDEKSGRWGGV